MSAFDAKWSPMIRILAHRTILVAPLCALMMAPAASAQEQIESLKSLGAALEKAVKCDVDALNLFSGALFNGDSGDPTPQLERLGVRIIRDARHDGDTRLRFPPGVKVFGHDAIDALSSAPSTTIFFINLRAGASSQRALNKTLKLVRVPKGNPDGYGYFEEFDASHVRKLKHYQRMPPDTIFSGIRNDDKHVVIGCQNLAW